MPAPKKKNFAPIATLIAFFLVISLGVWYIRGLTPSGSDLPSTGSTSVNQESLSGGSRPLVEKTKELKTPQETFSETYTGLINAKNLDGFLAEYTSHKDSIEQSIAAGSGAIFFMYPTIDRMVPFMYLCSMTESGDEKTVRSLMKKYSTILPGAVDSMPPEMKEQYKEFDRIKQEFFESKMGLSDFYTNVQKTLGKSLPKYYQDFLEARIASVGQSSNDCDSMLKKYDWFAAQ